jgi:D-lactate dehydrogenase (cytochrome)
MAPVAAQPRLTPAATQAALAALKQLLGDRFSTAQAVRDQHGRDESWNPAFPPDAVVFPHNTEEVAEVVKICASHGLPIIPYGAGTSLEGHVTALQGGVTIDLMQMNQILQVNAEDLDVVVQPGVRRKQLNEYLRDTGLFFPIDPGADASIGGMVSTRASGTNAVRYGTMRENVLALTVVMADGRVIRTSKRAKKSAAGYDLTRLFVGSEGTLGIVTEITLRLYGIPEAMSAATCSFATLEGAVNTVIQTIQAGIPVARIELLDDVQVQAINQYSKLSLPVQNMLMLEFHGTEASVTEQAEMVQGIASEHGGEGFRWATKAEERAKMWEARHNAAYACKALRKGCEIMATDVCVPISRLTDCILETKDDVVKTGLTAPLVGHVGDGNFHLSVVVDRSNPQEVETVEAFSERLVHRALRMEGTCTGEHGIGRGKMKYLTAEHGEAVSVMRAIKKALDPENLMNPGKIFSI